MEIRTVEGELSHVVRQTDGRKDVETGMKMLKFPIHYYVKALKILLKYRPIKLGLKRIFYNSFL